jgi:hypothetical protein
MPTNRKRTRRGRNPELPMAIIEKLVTGYTFFYDEPTETELEATYHKHRDFVLSFIGQRARDIEPDFFPAGATGIPVPYGCRPWAWWEFDAPEPRRLLSGDPAGAMPERGLWFGVPGFYRSIEAHNTLVYENQADYLRRLGLLLPGELEKIDERETPD